MKMVHNQPIVDFFEHEKPYVKGECKQCICTTSWGERCTRKSCKHQVCCWQHSKAKYALFENSIGFQNSTHEEKTLRETTFRTNRIMELQEMLIDVDRKLTEVERYNNSFQRNRGSKTLKRRQEILQNLLEVYRADDEKQPLFPDPLVLTDEYKNMNPYELGAKLVRHWKNLCGEGTDGFSNEFEDLTLDELKTIVRFNNRCWLAYSPEGGDGSSFIDYWQHRLNFRPSGGEENDGNIPDPITRQYITQEQKNLIMSAARLVNPDLTEPVANRNIPYPGGTGLSIDVIDFQTVENQHYYNPLLRGNRLYWYRVYLDNEDKTTDIGFFPQLVFEVDRNFIFDSETICTNLIINYDDGMFFKNHPPPPDFIDNVPETRVVLPGPWYWINEDTKELYDVITLQNRLIDLSTRVIDSR